MKKYLLLIILVLFPSFIHSQEGYREVTATGTNKLQLIVAPLQSLGGGESADIPREAAEVLRFDMTLAGPFAVMAPPVVTGKNGIRPGEFDFAPWKGAGADILVKGGYLIAGDKLTLEFRLYDVNRGKELTAKRYTGGQKDLRKIAHTFSDEIMQVMTGERSAFTGKIAFISKQTGNKEVCIMDYDGYNVQRLTKNGSINLNPDFSPNGKEIIYTSYKHGNPNLYRREIFTGTEVAASSQRGLNVTGAWSPDGKRIALALSKDGNSQIYSISREGKNASRLTRNSAIDVSPAWSPDGGSIAFVSDRLGKPQVFIMKADGSDVRRLTANGAYNVSPRWSPKGDRIAYCRQQGGGFQIYTINTDGSNDAQLTNDGSNEHPRWSPDGRFITFDSTRDGRQAIYVMRADGSGQTKVSRGKGGDSHPTWSPRW